MANDMGISKSVKFMGASKNILSHIHDGGMFVLTSDYEGLPNALLEAAAIGMPSISTDCSPGGARMIIKDDYSGFIVPCGDYEELAKKMAILADNKEKALFFSKNAVNIKENHKPEIIYKKWEDFIIKLVTNEDD